MLKQDFYKILPVALLALAIGLSPSFSVGTLDDIRPFNVRAEDIVLFLLFLFWIFRASFSKLEFDKFEKAPFFYAIFAWVVIGFLSLIINWRFGDLPLIRSFFFFLKEVEFFLVYFIVFFSINKKEAVNFITGLWIFLGVVNAAWIIFELLAGLKITYYYGPTTFLEPLGMFMGAGFFLMLFIFVFNLLLYYYRSLNWPWWKNALIISAVLSFVIGIISSGNRNAFWSGMFALFLIIILYIYKFRSSKKLISGILFLGIIFVLLISSYFFVTHYAPGVKRLFNTETMLREFVNPEKSLENITRIDTWISQIKESVKKPFFLVFGYGKASFFFTADSNSQYVRNFIETGVLGSLAFFFSIFLILKTSWQNFKKSNDPFVTAYSAGIVVSTFAMLLMSISHDAFTSVKIAESYWFFIALAITATSL